MKHAFFLLLLAMNCAAAESVLDEHLEYLRPLLGTWKGVFKNSTPEKPIVDVSRWERTLNGKAIRVLHSVNEGMYGGETLIYWDAGKKEVVYQYFTTAGFQTSGTSKFEEKKIVNSEKVSGAAGGVTEVNSTIELLSPDKFVMKATYLKDGASQGDREVTYTRESSAQVVFK